MVFRRLAVPLACAWHVASCGDRSSERAEPPKAGRAGVGGGSGGNGGAGDGGVGAGGTGGQGETAGGQSGMAGSSGRPPVGVCDNPYAWSENLESCNGDFVHRPTALGCTPPARDEAQGGIGGHKGGEDLSDCVDHGVDCSVVDQCTTDADCGANAYCIREVYDNDVDRIYYHICHTPCGSDADCADNELCACDYMVKNRTRARVQLGMCVPAECRTDADCGSESLCVDVFNPDPPWARGSIFEGFHCQSSMDECYSTDRCPTPTPDYDCCPVTSCKYEDDRYTCGWQDTCNLC